MQSLEMAHGIDRVAGGALTEFEFGNLELRLRGDREAQHGEAVLGGRVNALGLVRHLGRGHEDHAVKSVLGEGGLRRIEMAQMHRIKTSAQKAEVHTRETGVGEAGRKSNGNEAAEIRRSGLELMRAKR